MKLWKLLLKRLAVQNPGVLCIYLSLDFDVVPAPELFKDVFLRGATLHINVRSDRIVQANLDKKWYVKVMLLEEKLKEVDEAMAIGLKMARHSVRRPCVDGYYLGGKLEFNCQRSGLSVHKLLKKTLAVFAEVTLEPGRPKHLMRTEDINNGGQLVFAFW